jgi:hypothetical protein
MLDTKAKGELVVRNVKIFVGNRSARRTIETGVSLDILSQTMYAIPKYAMHYK